MFLFSPKFDWSFSHLPRFNWGCWTLPKCSYFTQMFLILPKTLLKFFSWAKFDEGCWNYHMIPVHSTAVFILPSGAKKNGKIVFTVLQKNVLFIILPLIWLLFCLSLENRHYLITCDCSCILSPNFEYFCPNNGQFFSVGDATASSASPFRMLLHIFKNWFKNYFKLLLKIARFYVHFHTLQAVKFSLIYHVAAHRAWGRAPGLKGVPKSDWVSLLRHIETPELNSPRTYFTPFPFQFSYLSTCDIRQRNLSSHVP